MYQVDLFSGLYSSFKFDPSKPLKLFEAFAGYGSQYMALKRLGVKVNVVGISEIDKYAILVYASMHTDFLNVVSKMYIKSKSITSKYTIKDLLNMPDFTKFLFESKILKIANELSKNYGGIGSFDRLPPNIDICTWSFPCQDISLAGKQKGMEDGSRSNYGYIFLDTVEATPYHERPKMLLMENVRALFSVKFRDDWREIQLRLERMGYTNHANVLNAKDYGVAQNRERVFIVSILGEYNYTFPKPIQLTKRLKDYLEDEVDEKYYLSDKMINYISQQGTKNFKLDTKINLEIARPITTDQNKSAGTTNYIASNLPENFDLKVVGNTNPSGRGMNGNVYDSNGLAPTLTTNKGEGLKIILPEKTDTTICINSKVNGKQPSLQDRIYDSRGIATAITTSFNPSIINNLRIRKLTPKECFRLMDVSESDIDIITSTVSNAQAYKLAGNSIVVSVLEAIFKELLIK